MRVSKSAALALVALTLAALPVRAQDAATVEVTPYVALGSAGVSPVGVAVTFPVTSTLGVETDVAYRRGEGRIHTLSTTTSLLWSLPRIGANRDRMSPGEWNCRSTGRPFFPPPALLAELRSLVC